MLNVASLVLNFCRLQHSDHSISCVVFLKVEFMPKFSVRGIWQRWRESYPGKETKANDAAVTVFTGVSHKGTPFHVIFWSNVIAMFGWFPYINDNHSI
jgi:hypothetical protein